MGFMHRRNNYICQGTIVAQKKYEWLHSAHPLSSLRTSSLIKKIMRSMVATFIMASWEAEDAKAKEGRKETIYLWRGQGWGGQCLGILLRSCKGKKTVCAKHQEGSSQESGAGAPCGLGHSPGSSFDTRTSPLAS